MSIQANVSNVPELTLGWRLQMALRYARVSVQEMADELDMSRAGISRWINDRGNPPRAIFIKQWALKTGVDVNWLLTGETPAQPRAGGGTFFCTPSGTRTQNPLIKGLGATVVPLPRRTAIGDDAA